MDQASPVQEDWSVKTPIREDWHQTEFKTLPTMIVDENARQNTSAPCQNGGWGYCCWNRSILNDANGRWLSQSKYFDTTVESANLSRSVSNSSTSACLPSENNSYWICTRCRQWTDSEKHKFGRVNDVIFYACSPCYKEYKHQMWFGYLFRNIQFHMTFTMLWIPSPDGAFLGDKHRNKGEWVGIVVLLVITLLFEIMSVINVTVVRQLALVKRIQKKRPVLDTWIEAMCALCWVIVIAMMVFDGIHQYPSGHWNGRLIGLLACAGIMFTSYLFTATVAWMIVIRETARSFSPGYPESLGQRRAASVWQAIAFL